MVITVIFKTEIKKKESVFSTKQHGLLIRLKLYVLKTEFSITSIGDTMIFSFIMHIDNYSNIRKGFIKNIL